MGRDGDFFRSESMFVQWAPANRENYLDYWAWSTEAIPASFFTLLEYIPAQLENGPGIIAVNLDTGEVSSEILLDWKIEE